MIPPLFSVIAAMAFRPFVDPLPVGENAYWPWLLLPLSVGVALVYKSIRCKSMKRVPRDAAVLALVIILGMVAAAILLGLLVRGLEWWHDK